MCSISYLNAYVNKKEKKKASHCAIADKRENIDILKQHHKPIISQILIIVKKNIYNKYKFYDLNKKML